MSRSAGGASPDLPDAPIPEGGRLEGGRIVMGPELPSVTVPRRRRGIIAVFLVLGLLGTGLLVGLEALGGADGPAPVRDQPEPSVAPPTPSLSPDEARAALKALGLRTLRPYNVGDEAIAQAMIAGFPAVSGCEVVRNAYARVTTASNVELERASREDFLASLRQEYPEAIIVHVAEPIDDPETEFSDVQHGIFVAEC